jgi:hypothetical protein
MFKNLVRTFAGPSRDPRMAYISRPLPSDLPYEQVVAALELALAQNPNPRYLVETLPAALKQVTGRDLEVLDRSVSDVTGRYSKSMVMIRDGDVGLWRGYETMRYPLLAKSAKHDETQAALSGTDPAAEPSPTSPVGKPGWAPPPPVDRRA